MEVVGTVNFETVGVFGAFVLGIVLAAGGVGVRILKSSQKDATREVVKDEVLPILEKHDQRITLAELELVDQKVAVARLMGIQEGRKEMREGR